MPVDLSTVWVVADLYEKDFSRIRVQPLGFLRICQIEDCTVPNVLHGLARELRNRRARRSGRQAALLGS